jgi:microcompartment protein CcmL/EutN
MGIANIMANRPAELTGLMTYGKKVNLTGKGDFKLFEVNLAQSGSGAIVVTYIGDIGDIKGVKPISDAGTAAAMGFGEIKGDKFIPNYDFHTTIDWKAGTPAVVLQTAPALQVEGKKEKKNKELKPA